ncbi:MAG: hypothetical protein ABIJ91_02705 [Candidatus Kuenenbacteria bacterium]
MENNIFSNTIENWLLNYHDILSRPKQMPGAKIHISEAAGKLAFIYEKIRNTIDYKEDHLIRKSAITRIIKRVLITGKKGSDMARPIIEELIGARYLANGSVPELSSLKVRDILNKYIVIYNAIVDRGFTKEESKDFYEWLVKLAGCEIEELLMPDPQDKITVDAMHRAVRQNVVIQKGNTLDETDKNIQIYIGVLKSLLKADEVTVSYSLIKYYFPEWQTLTLKEADRLAVDIKNKQSLIKYQYSHPLNERLAKEFKKYAVTFWTLQDVIAAHQDNYLNIFKNKKLLADEITKVCTAKYKTIRGKVRRSIVRSVIYIFLTKIIFGLLLEFPFDYFILQRLDLLPLAVNALFPPVLMTSIGLSIRTPKRSNTEEIIKEVWNIVYGIQGEEHNIKLPRVRKGFASFMLKFFYLIMYGISFGVIIYGLDKLGFSPASMAIFLLFLTLVSFFSLRIRRNAAELIVLQKKERFHNIILTFLAIPILRVGRWISINSSKVNFFIFFFDFIIEAPFKMFIRIFEDLVVYIKEKRDEML